jgi:acyl-CoA synthetase (AMP-forming)/AMP-acid ligase II
MIGAVKPLLLAGGALAILPAFEPLEVIAAIARYRITYLTGVPAMYKMLLAERAALAMHDVRSVQYAICGSAEVPEDLLAEFTRVFGAPIAEGYGLTEGGPVPLFNTRTGPRRRGSCGREVAGSEVRLVRPDGADVAPDEVGELLVRNPGVSPGYWKLPEETRRKFRDGWLHTGDLFRRDAQGFYYFRGRTDDVINVSGEKVYPKEIEDILLRHPEVRDACVVPAPHETKGQVPVAFVALHRGATADEAVLQDFCQRHGPPYAYPRRVTVLDALPLTGAGKPDRAGLARRAGPGSA